jgi:hypothetical protein
MGFFKRRTILIVLVLFFIAIQLFSLDLRERNSQNPVSKLVLNITYYPQMAVSRYRQSRERLAGLRRPHA